MNFIRTVIQVIQQQLQNQFLSGALVVMLTGSILALCRKVPHQFWAWVRRRTTITVDVSNDDPAFAWLSLWLAAHPYSGRARSLTATTERDEYRRSDLPRSADEDALPQILFTPAPGSHLLLYRRRLLWLERERKEAAPGSGSDSFVSLWKREVFTIRVIGRNQEVARRLLEDARGIALSRRRRKVEIFIAGYDYWQSIDERDPRPLSSVFLPEGMAEEIVHNITKFLGNQSWYIQRGIPWRLGCLFYGVSGSGKTMTRLSVCLLEFLFAA